MRLVMDSQESKRIELLDILDASSGKGKDGPGCFEKRNVKRYIDLIIRQLGVTNTGAEDVLG